MPRCLLCGHSLDAEQNGLARCTWCEREATTLSQEEVAALQKLDQIEPAFEVWCYGRREDAEARGVVTKNRTPVPQPARLLPGLPLYLGDLDDAKDVDNLKKLGIGCVINLCADKVASSRQYRDVPGRLAEAKIHHHILVAEDARHFKILPVVQMAFGIINATLAQEANNGVLVHCWGGVNRSAACVVAFLVTQYKVPLYAAVAQSMKQRGSILTNQSFRAQLVRFCFQQGLDLCGEEVPAPLWQAPADPVALGDAQSCNDRTKRHKKEPPKDSNDHGLRFAVRDGCLKCVMDYIEQGVDPEKKGKNYSPLDWAEWKLSRAPHDQEKRQYHAILVSLQRARGQAESA